MSVASFLFFFVTVQLSSLDQDLPNYFDAFVGPSKEIWRSSLF